MLTINLPNGSAVLLYHMLGSEKWAKTPKDIYLAGKTMTQLEDIKEAMPDERRDPEKYKQWVQETSDLEIKESTKDVCKKCINFVSGEGVVRPSPVVVNPLLEAFGVVDIEE